MRDYQTKANVDGAADSNTATKFGATEFNSLASESKQAVSLASLTLSDSSGTSEDTTQLAQALFINGAGASSFTASGTANVIVLAPVTGSTGLLLPSSYDNLNGTQVGFLATTTNTGDTTLSIGQSTSSQIGSKKFLTLAGAELSAGAIASGAYITATYDSTADTNVGAWALTTASTGIGDVVGPSSSTTASIAVFSGTTGKLLVDGGSTISAVLTSAGDVDGPSSSTDTHIAVFSGTGGKLIANGGQTIAEVITAAASPTGTVVQYINATAPTGWANCDGTAISRTTFSDLFALIGTSYGTGDGTTTFNLPDTRGRSPFGQGTGSGLTARTIGDSTGAETHQLTTAEMPSHSHSITTNISSGSSTTLVTVDNVSTTTSATESTGGAGTHNNMQPSLAFNFIIKT